MDIKENVPLAPYTTFGIGGPARYLISAQSIEDIKAGLKFAAKKAQRVFILGGGSNLLVNDEGFYGLVLKIELTGVEIQRDEVNTAAGVTCIAFAGEGWDALVKKTCNEKWWGLENLSGIPGTVGGAVVQNIGAYGTALSEVLLWAEAFNTETGEVRRFSNAECAFGYRDSFFKHHANYVVLRAALKLSSVPQPNTSYKDLAQLFGNPAGVAPDIQALRTAVLAIRKGKFPDLALEGTAGSFFKNPIVNEEEAQLLEELYPGLPVFVMPETRGVKVPLAWFLDPSHGVIDAALISAGGARLYEKQPLVIVAQKNTSSGDVAKVASEVQKQIKEKLHIEIEPEVKII